MRATAESALASLAAQLRGERSVVSEHVADATGEPAALGALVAAGPRAAASSAEYALVIESVREGYLLHYGEPRIVTGADADLALLSGDYLYALGLERLANLGDLEAVRELSDLITVAARIHDGERSGDEARRQAAALWLGSCVAIATGRSDPHEAAKRALVQGSSGAGDAVFEAARAAAAKAGLGEELESASDSIDFRPNLLS